MPIARPINLLVDNGSLEPAATRGLRRLAAELSALAGEPVEPVSLLHSSGIAATELDGRPAVILEPALRTRAAAGTRQFHLVPLFFGPSRALTDYLPARVAALRATFPDLTVRLGPPLAAPGDERLARILADHVRATAGSARHAVVVDHGSPARAVTAVRDALAGQVRALLGPDFTVAAASMERRPEPEFDFNAPLLADLLSSAPWNSREVVVAMQFLLPGRHAGPHGDVAGICADTTRRHPGLVTRMTALVGDHPSLPAILLDRLRQTRLAAPLG